MLPSIVPCSRNTPLFLPSRPLAHISAEDVDLEGYHTLRALFDETYSLVAETDSEPNGPVGLALNRCEINQKRLESLLYGMGYSVPNGKEVLSNIITWRLKRYLKHNERENLQRSYRDSVLLLRDIVLR
jgi:hypothetical protein